jgi:four helix bundle protein
MTRADLKDRTKQFALRVMQVSNALPQNKPSGRAISDQIVRSGTSVAANYRSSQRARSTAEYVSKLNVCLEEVDETSFWLELITESGLLPAPKVKALQQESEELTAIFASAIKTTRERSRTAPKS